MQRPSEPAHRESGLRALAESDRAVLRLVLADIVLKGYEQSFGMLGSHYDPVAYFRFRKARKHRRKVDYEFTVGMGYDGQVRVRTFGYLLFELDAQFFFICHDISFV